MIQSPSKERIDVSFSQQSVELNSNSRASKKAADLTQLYLSSKLSANPVIPTVKYKQAVAEDADGTEAVPAGSVFKKEPNQLPVIASIATTDTQATIKAKSRDLIVVEPQQKKLDEAVNAGVASKTQQQSPQRSRATAMSPAIFCSPYSPNAKEVRDLRNSVQFLDMHYKKRAVLGRTAAHAATQGNNERVIIKEQDGQIREIREQEIEQELLGSLTENNGGTNR